MFDQASSTNTTWIPRTLDDFEAVIVIFSTEQGGRLTPACNGIRWDFGYGNDPAGSEIYMIHPDFFDDHGSSIPSSQPLTVGVELKARMTVGIDEMRARLHRSRIQVGTRFFCHEGSKRVAEGVVTRITGLFDKRP